MICSTSPRSPLPPAVIISSGPTITFVDRHFGTERSFTAWDANGRATALEEAGGILVGIGEEEGSRWPVLKIWDLTREERKRTGAPVLMRNVRIQHGQRPHPVSPIHLRIVCITLILTRCLAWQSLRIYHTLLSVWAMGPCCCIGTFCNHSQHRQRP